MKRIWIGFFLLNLSATAFAQRSPVRVGNWRIGGSAQYVISSYKPVPIPNTNFDYSSKTRVINLYPELQYFIERRLAVGGSLAYGHVKDLKNEGTAASVSYAVGPEVTLFLKDRGKLLPYISARYKWERSKMDTYEQKGWGYGASGGALYLLNRHVGLTAEFFTDISITPASYAPEKDHEWTGKGLRFGFSAFLK